MKLSLNGLIGYLQGKGWKLQVNEDAESENETFEVLEEPNTETEETAELSDEVLSEEELKALKGLATVLAKNGKLIDAIGAGTLDQALSAVPAAAQLVANAAEREKLEKDQLIAVIKQNSSNIYSDEELATFSVPVLTKMNAQMNVSYAGLGGAVFQNAEQPLLLPSSLVAQAQEVKNGS